MKKIITSVISVTLSLLLMLSLTSCIIIELPIGKKYKSEPSDYDIYHGKISRSEDKIETKSQWRYLFSYAALRNVTISKQTVKNGTEENATFYIGDKKGEDPDSDGKMLFACCVYGEDDYSVLKYENGRIYDYHGFEPYIESENGSRIEFERRLIVAFIECDYGNRFGDAEFDSQKGCFVVEDDYGDRIVTIEIYTKEGRLDKMVKYDGDQTTTLSFRDYGTTEIPIEVL